MYDSKLNLFFKSTIFFFIFQTEAFAESSVNNLITNPQIETGKVQPLQSPGEEALPQIQTPVTIPVFAKKAGGHLKPIFLNNFSNSTPSVQLNKSLSKEDEANKIDSKLEEKALSLSNETLDDEDLKDSKVEKDYNGYEESEEEMEEPECPDDQFWHIRGFRCVPIQCPGGNQWRDVNTGECILRHYGKPGNKRRWNRFKRIYWPLGSSARSRFTGEGRK